MTHKANWLGFGVYKVDTTPQVRVPVPNPTAAPLPLPRAKGRKQQRRFREAVPEYRALLGGAASRSLDEFYGACLTRWAERWAERNLRSLTENEVHAYIIELTQKGHSEDEIRREKSLFQSFFRWACRSGFADEDPARNLRHLPRLPAPRPAVWNGIEQRRLLEACLGKYAAARDGASSCRRPSGTALQPPPTPGPPPPPYLYPLVLVGLRTGMRLGNLLNLEWSHVDFTVARIVLPAVQVRTNRAVEVPLAVDAVWVLRELLHRAQQLPCFPRRVFDAVGLPRWKEMPDARAVLMDFRVARKKAGISEGDFHSLRLCFLRNCARAGVPPAAAARMADWEETSLLADIYRESLPMEVLPQAPARDPGERKE